MKNKNVLLVLNKSDLGSGIEEKDLDFDFADSVRISAKTGDGIELLAEKIQRRLGVKNLEPDSIICFTARQKRLLEQLQAVKGKSIARKLITELLHGKVI